MKILITGASSGVGRACVDLLGPAHEVIAPRRQELDLENFEQISNLDLRDIDVVINAAGANVGSYLGWRKNTWQNQSQQVAVNFTGALLLAKQYMCQRQQGQFVFVTSYNIEDPIALNIFYTASKAALKYAVQTLRRENPNIVFTEICPGKIRTNMLQQNYQDAKTPEQIQALYAQSASLEPHQVASIIQLSIQQRLNQITMVPYEST